MKRPRRREIRAKLRRERVPSEEDWGDYKSDLDQNHAHKMFSKRNNEEMQSYFLQNVLERTSDLRWMPKVPFQYYMIGFRDFIAAGNFEPGDASDATGCFLNLTIEKLENHPDFILPIMPDLMPTIEFVAGHQNIFHKKLKQIRALYSQAAG